MDSTPAAGCGAAVVIGAARVVFGWERGGLRRLWCRGQGRGVCRIGARHGVVRWRCGPVLRAGVMMDRAFGPRYGRAVVLGLRPRLGWGRAVGAGLTCFLIPARKDARWLMPRLAL